MTTRSKEWAWHKASWPKDKIDLIKSAHGGKIPDVFINDIYQVAITPVETSEGWPRMVHLSIKRRDKDIVHDWRHLQRIKNELVGPECEGIELYPAESRLADSANQYHLWVIAEPGIKFPIGFANRMVSETMDIGNVQRPWDDDVPPEVIKERKNR